MPIGEVHHIPFLKEDELRSFLLEHEKSVIFFTDGQFKYDFANYAIHRFGHSISFAAAPIEAAEKYNAKGPLFILAFYKSEIVKVPDAPFSAIAFTNWCDNAFAKTNIKITHPEELRVIFVSTITCCFGVDMTTRPEKLREDITFYQVPHQFFTYFNMNVSKGYYIYRSADRQLVKMDKDPNKFLTTKVTDLHSSNLVRKPFFGGFFMKESNVSLCHTESKLLNTLANKYNDDFYFGPLSGTLADTIARQYNLLHVQKPFFAIFDTKGRWIKTGDEIHDINALTKFIEDIKSKSINYTVRSDGSGRLSKRVTTVTYENAIDTIMNDGKDSILYITGRCGPRCTIYDTLIKEDAKIFENSTVKFYMLNASTNDIPAPLDPNVNIPIFYELPSKKKMFGPIEYDGTGRIDDFNRFILIRSSGPFEEPKYNASAIDTKAKQKAFPFLKKSIGIASQENATATDANVTSVEKDDSTNSKDLTKEL